MKTTLLTTGASARLLVALAGCGGSSPTTSSSMTPTAAAASPSGGASRVAASSPAAATSGDPLPTVRSLADQLNVNFNTIARAYRALDQEGWIYTHQGRGTQVAEREEIRPEHVQSAQESYRKALVEQTLSLATQAGITPRELREEIERQLPHTKKQRMHSLSHRIISRKIRSILAMNKKNAEQRKQLRRDNFPVKKTKSPQKTRRR